jgi:diketogulonate reductase-like aldo/keto reductase
LSEAAIGRWFKRTGKRDDIFLATKFGFIYEESGLGLDTSPEHCKEACEKSLQALGVETIDLCMSSLAYKPTKNITLIDDTINQTTCTSLTKSHQSRRPCRHSLSCRGKLSNSSHHPGSLEIDH